MLGTSIGQYRVVELLGSGSMGVVYKAVDETLDREVAIKILNPDLDDPELMRRLRTEATTLAKLNHPEIATIYELRRTDQSVVMVMEFVRGEALDKVLERSGSLPVETVAYVVDRVLSVLSHAHQLGIVHRDIKPANVMVTASGGIKVMDFGIAFMRDAEQTGVGNDVVGTPGYMPPEQIRGQDIDGRSDLYAVGVIFYRLLTGAFPFRADTIEDMLRKQLSGVPPIPLNHYRSGLPEWCERIVARALSASPSDRFQNAAQFRSALKQETHAVPERTARLTVSELGRLGVTRPAVPATTPREIATAVLPRTASGSRRSAIAIAAIGVLVLFYFSPWRLASTREPGTTTPTQLASTPTTSAPPVSPPTPAADVASPKAEASPPPAPTKAGRKRPIINTKPLGAVDANVTPLNASPLTIDAARGPVASDVAAKPAAFPPVVFDAKALVGAGDRQSEREVNVQLAQGYLAVTAAALATDVLYRQPYEAVRSIAYSLSRHPLWLSANGPAPAARTGRVLGIFPRTPRHWVTVRSGDVADPVTIVLRFENAEQVRDVVRAFADRTGQRAVRVVEPRDPK